jgi:type I restriction enzyme S subunit
MAQAIFKSWFVDFEPWGGVMPEGWREIKLSEIVETVSGYSYKGSELIESTTAMATIKNFERVGGFKLNGFKEIAPSNKVKPKQFINLYETIVAHTDLTQRAEVVGNAEMLLSNGGYDRIVASMDLVKVLPAVDGLTKFVLGTILRSPLFKEHCLGYVNGTTVLHMSKRAIPEYSLVFPDNPCILIELDAMLAPIYKQMSLNIEESTHLAALRDALLPRLMSGELEVCSE